ncbi:Flp pilus assembly protein CpaB [Georgenia subflava]|uniref:Uncharacterized protein n=1 Tax=Georgenia subflava TaxID=1622177 RepID=A0A6N7EJT0_9MICO|nr:RcpC/CpaB family pilus assembly protein [Georgenia subflava]MPV37017.1 hypothetical protein [Georgenia subflava]
MTRRIVAALAAVLLAVVGAVLLVGYVAGADQRAMAGMETTPVLEVVEPVAAGTPAAELAELVTVADVPRSMVASGAVASLTEIDGLVATTDLLPGEQLLGSRFADPASLVDPARVEVPAGMHEVSVLLESQRVLGSSLAAGDTVGVFITRSGETHLALHKVLVTRVQGGITPPTPTAEGAEAVPAPVPQGSVMVTLAVAAPDAERIVWAAEHGGIWLSAEPGDAPEDGTRAVNETSVYE